MWNDMWNNFFKKKTLENQSQLKMEENNQISEMKTYISLPRMQLNFSVWT